VAAPGDGRLKLRVVSALLRLRRRLPSLFTRGDYLPLEADGRRAPNLFAFAREHEARAVVVVVPRLTVALSGGAAPIGEAVWADTCVRLPEAIARRGWTHELTGERIEAREGALAAAALFATSPVAVLVADGR